MASGFGVAGTATAGVILNTVYTTGHKADPFPVLLAGSIVVGACVAVAAIRPEIGQALAVLYLLSTVLTRGPYFVDILSKATDGK